MAEDEDELKDVEFIPAYEDARLRLDCFLATKSYADDFENNLEGAQALYDWVMEIEAEAEPSALTPEDKCEPKPH